MEKETGTKEERRGKMTITRLQKKKKKKQGKKEKRKIGRFIQYRNKRKPFGRGNVGEGKNITRKKKIVEIHMKK